MGSLSVGDQAPDFELPGTEGAFKLSDHHGERVVLLFYPGDDTSVCTKQFCSYRDNPSAFGELDATIVGISTKDVASKEAFKAKHGLTVPLLADEDGTVAAAYGVKSRIGGFTKRSVFIVGPDGKVAFRHLNPMSLSYDGVDDLRDALAKVPAAA